MLTRSADHSKEKLQEGSDKITGKNRKRMVATNLKSQTITLMAERSAMEAEMNAIIERLCQPGGPGLSGNLVDSEVLRFSLQFDCLLDLDVKINFLSWLPGNGMKNFGFNGFLLVVVFILCRAICLT